MAIYCVAYGCKNLQLKGSNLKFHGFPLKKPQLLDLWVKAVRREDWKPTKYSKLCSCHFKEEDYLERPSKSSKRLSILRPDAVPSIFNYDLIELQHRERQTINSKPIVVTSLPLDRDISTSHHIHFQNWTDIKKEPDEVDTEYCIDLKPDLQDVDDIIKTEPEEVYELKSVEDDDDDDDDDNSKDKRLLGEFKMLDSKENIEEVPLQIGADWIDIKKEPEEVDTEFCIDFEPIITDSQINEDNLIWTTIIFEDAELLLENEETQQVLVYSTPGVPDSNGDSYLLIQDSTVEMYTDVEFSKNSTYQKPSIHPEGNSSSIEEEKGKLSCDICLKRFAIKYELRLHMNIHIGNKEYSCAICNKAYASKSSLYYHLNIHTQKITFSCDICNKIFVRKGQLIDHMSIHTGRKKYSCDFCGKSYIHKSNFYCHTNIHTGYKIFPCDICNRVFVRKWHLTDHMSIHKGPESFPCNICGKAFAGKRQMDMHRISHFRN